MSHDSIDIIQPLLTTVFIGLAALVWGLAAVPALALVVWSWRELEGSEIWTQLLGGGLSIGGAYAIWSMTTVLIVGILGFIIRPRLSDQRVPLRSFTTIRWAMTAALARMAIRPLQMLTLTWVANLYYRMMGCKIGRRVQINTHNLNDCFMISIGDGTVIGGNATINGHSAEKDELVLASVRIGVGCVIGGHSLIGPGCNIGDGAVIAFHAVLPKYTEVPADEVWGGVPARRIRAAAEE